MNIVTMIGRLTADPVIRESKGKEPLAIANFSLAVPRVGSEDADFPRCVAFGKTAEFIEKYLQKGSKIGVVGRIQTGSYEDKEGNTVYTTEVIVERVDFADGKKDDDSPRSTRSDRKGGRR